MDIKYDIGIETFPVPPNTGEILSWEILLYLFTIYSKVFIY
jgi:hypothetical protein